ncbi:unnamed protein product [Prorocentrum cordatum]|uniref:Glutamate/phenylalanine/leucine/valine/L-tryptophan dehydrogenase C-terminal domain-containing protein n=1 Tax=Prorocentrum cordatum TaxID=2364126 RepID=A0ABN9SJJ8_9DINO|nr:unnamed protein product [Polarella glacialis]
MVVEGANLFLSDLACAVLERAGVHVFKDASTNKGGVNGSSLEVLAALALPPEDHEALMAYDPDAGGEPPEFRQAYVKQMFDTIVDNSRKDFRAIWTCNQNGMPKVEASRRLSMQINRVKDSFEYHHESMSETERNCLTRSVLRKGAVPPVMLERLGLEGILRNVPANYVLSMVSAWIASRYVYRFGLDASEVSFFLFLRELMRPEDSEGREAERPGGSGEQDDAAPANAGAPAAAAAPAPGASPGQKRPAREAAECAPAAARLRLGTF